MTVPYNMLPIETHMAMISAELANVPVLLDAARMWTEVRGWIGAAQVELRSRTSTLTPEWTDDAGRALAEKLQRSQSELQMWGDRIDSANVSATLTTLASAIPEAHAEVSGLYSAYLAAIATPFGQPAALALQQASGTRMTALGAHFDASMLTVCAAAGAANPADLVPGLNANTPNVSASDLTKTVNDATDALTALQGLDSSLTSGGSQPDLSGLTNAVSNAGLTTPDLSSLTSAGGPSLAGLTGTATMPALPGGDFGIGALSGGSAPVAATSPGSLGALGGAGAFSLPMTPASRAMQQSQSSNEEVRPGNAVGAMPMTSPHTGTGGGMATLRPGTAEAPGNQQGRGRRAAAESDGVLSALRGRSGSGDAAGFSLPRAAQPGETQSGSVELLDEELWQVRSTSTW